MFRRWVFTAFFISMYFCIESASNETSNRLGIDESLSRHQIHLIDHLLKIFCQIRSNFINVLTEKHVPSAFADQIVHKISSCLSVGILTSG